MRFGVIGLVGAAGRDGKRDQGYVTVEMLGHYGAAPATCEHYEAA